MQLYPGRHVDRTFSVCYFIPNFVTLCAMLRLGDAWQEAPRVRGGFMGYLASLFAIPFVDLLFIGGSGRGSGFSYFLTLVLCAVTGVSDAVAQGSLFGSTARQSPMYSQIMMAGTAASGVLISLLRCGIAPVCRCRS